MCCLFLQTGWLKRKTTKKMSIGEGRMLNTLSSYSGAPAKEILRGLMTSADQFVGTAAQHDDITCLVLRTVPG